MRNINKIIIHCSATEAGQEISIDTIREWHIERGFKDIGYHYVIGLDGAVFTGRNITEIGAHTKGQNSDSVGICYVGGLLNGKAKDTRTKEQKNVLKLLIYQLKQVFPDASAEPHYKYANKDCPCFNVEAEYYA